MKTISQQEADLIVAASNEGLTNFPPAALEKDILLTEVLHAIKSNKLYKPNLLQPVFGGGTSLIKGFSIISRMSEDLDFKVISQNQAPTDLNKKELGLLRDSIRATLEAQGFSIEDEDKKNSRRYFNFELGYKSSFDSVTSLRSNIQVEFTCSLLSVTPQLSKISTLLYRDTNISNPYDFEVLCVDPSQTAGEKIIGLLRNVKDIQAGSDDRLVRHIYDLHLLKESGLNTKTFSGAIFAAVEEDFARFKTAYPEDLVNNTVDYLRKSLEDLIGIENLDAIYQAFVTDLISGLPVPLETALRSLRQLVQHIELDLHPE
jgi:predicted nucleotidyltransferase component of viral defense system